MSVLSKILAVLSMVCYLATSSIAVAHAFPMMGGMSGIGGSDRIAAEATTSVGEKESLKVAARTMMDCHQFANSSADSVKASGICKIFCSAIGNALPSTQLIELASLVHNTSPVSTTASLTTIELSVEHQPPK